MSDQLPSIEELPDGYDLRCGGYRVAYPNEKIHEGRYVLRRKLGFGFFSTVWLALDILDQKYTAIKIVKSTRVAKNCAWDEIRFLRLINARRVTRGGHHHPGAQHVVTLFDNFSVASEIGDQPHTCLAMEPLGENLSDVIYNLGAPSDSPHRGVPTYLAKLITTQLLKGLDFLHNVCDIVHADLKPENVLVVLNDIHALAHEMDPLQETDFSLGPRHLQFVTHIVEGRFVPIYRSCPFPPSAALQPGASKATMRSIQIRICDFGSATLPQSHRIEMIQTPVYRAPEVILGYPWDHAVDLWSLGCIVFELVTGEMMLFPESADGQQTSNVDHLAQIICLMGSFPTHILPHCHHRDMYFLDDAPRFVIDTLAQSMHELLTQEMYGFVYPDEEAKELCGFIEPLLALDPTKRSTPEDALGHSWLVLDDVEHDSPK